MEEWWNTLAVFGQLGSEGEEIKETIDAEVLTTRNRAPASWSCTVDVRNRAVVCVGGWWLPIIGNLVKTGQMNARRERTATAKVRSECGVVSV